ncbi:hypothetical protein KR038_003592 [Drosophila bunnanda]|nr:hypothetical protein KR038_003592 [Drosophila bunnanda]
MRNKNCRVCSGQEATLNIFEPENNHLVRQIQSITGVELIDRVELSSHLCLVCLGDLNAAIKFRQRCIISEKQNLERVDAALKGNSIQPVEQHGEIDDTEIELYFTKKDEATLLLETREPVLNPGEVEEVAAKKPKPKTVGRGEPYVCGDCGKSISRSNFLEHKLRHSGIKDFHCQFGCGKSFVTRKELIRHNRTHTGEKPFACSYCPLSFSDESARLQHHRRHRDERNFHCDVCEKSFISSGCLSKHKVMHSSERQFR